MIAPPIEDTAGGYSGFNLELPNFSGPFDLLLSLVTKHQLDITEISLARVTDEFINYLKEFPSLTSASEFLVVAATLLEIKTRSLLPDTEDEEADREYIAARDLLFARLLQYRAYQEVALVLAERFQQFQGFFPRVVPLEEHFRELLPKFEDSVDSQALAVLAYYAINRVDPVVEVSHLHFPRVPVRTQIEVLLAKLQARRGSGVNVITFQDLVDDTDDIAVRVARFLGILEMYRSRIIDLQQSRSLGEISVSLTEEGASGAVDTVAVDDYEGD
ncbi:MAG: ScpA family protein [Varibaculum sp.]|nr:ScpA family protein [Varibaculum sp.]